MFLQAEMGMLFVVGLSPVLASGSRMTATQLTG